MYKLLLLTLMSAVWVLMHALQADEEAALRLLFAAKHGVNRAAHAATQQLDEGALSQGILRLDAARASNAGLAYLQANLRLDAAGMPLADSVLRDRVEVLVFRVVNDGESFPYIYRNAAYNYEVTLRRPGVVMIVRVKYPRAFNVLPPIEWEIKGAAELVEIFR